MHETQIVFSIAFVGALEVIVGIIEITIALVKPRIKLKGSTLQLLYLSGLAVIILNCLLMIWLFCYKALEG